MSDSKALKLICSGILQSWRNTGLGPNCRYTELMPTKSGIAGIIACALGYPRGDSRIEKLKNSFELYIDNKTSTPIKPGANTTPDVLFDFQTVSAPDMLTAGGGMLHSPSIIMREYVVGYRYVLYLKAEEELLRKIETALNEPVWDYYLGSKCCIPAEPVCRGMCEMPEVEDDNVYQHIRI